MSRRYIDADKIQFLPLSVKIGCNKYDVYGAEPERVIMEIHDMVAYKGDIDAIPTADVEEVRHGKWEHGREIGRKYIGDALLAIYYDKWWCSQCHYTIDDHHYSKITYKRCPECGARMDGGENGTN